MKMTARFLTVIVGSILLSTSVAAQSDRLITANSAGKVKLGMTVAEARKALAPLILTRTSDGEGVALIAVKRGTTDLLTLYAGEEDATARLNENARIEQIWVWDNSYRTAAGVHPGMLLAKAERRYGKISEISKSEIESREFATFSNHPKGMTFRLRNVGDSAGVYPKGSRTTTQYAPRTYISSIIIAGQDQGNNAFTSEYTSLRSGCRMEGGEEGGHVSTYCKGPRGYQLHYHDTATTYQLHVETENRDWSRPVTMFGLEYLYKTKPVEWRLANGVPFAAIFIHPQSGKVFVKGLRGFERIDFENEGEGALDLARSAADEKYAEIAIRATRIHLGNSTKAIVKGTILKIGDKLKYVIKAKRGDKLTVSVSADKWTGDDGPILIVFVTMPDGNSEGQPGGFDDVLTQDGDHEILVKQNAAKSRAENIEFTMTITRVKSR